MNLMHTKLPVKTVVKIYTRTGDGGETGLVGGTRVSKDSLRVQAYGDVDELNSILGIVRSFLSDAELDKLLREIQRDLFVVGSDLAAPLRAQSKIPRISDTRISELEKEIDALEEELPPLQTFILPSGTQPGSLLHFARTVARRAERAIVTLRSSETINAQLVPYMNRLSDLLFVIARVTNHRNKVEEMQWHVDADE